MTYHRPHHQHRQCEMRIATYLTKEVASMATKMRNITQQNALIQQFLM